MRLRSTCCTSSTKPRMMNFWFPIRKLHHDRFKAEALLRTGTRAGLAADAVARIGDPHEHLGGIVAVQLFKLQHIVGTDLVAATATDAGLLVDGVDELRGPLLFVACQSGNVSHLLPPFCVWWVQFLFVTFKTNPPQSPLSGGKCLAPPLIRGGREGLIWCQIVI